MAACTKVCSSREELEEQLLGYIQIVFAPTATHPVTKTAPHQFPESITQPRSAHCPVPYSRDACSHAVALVPLQLQPVSPHSNDPSVAAPDRSVLREARSPRGSTITVGFLAAARTQGHRRSSGTSAAAGAWA